MAGLLIHREITKVHLTSEYGGDSERKCRSKTTNNSCTRLVQLFKMIAVKTRQESQSAHYMIRILHVYTGIKCVKITIHLFI